MREPQDRDCRERRPVSYNVTLAKEREPAKPGCNPTFFSEGLTLRRLSALALAEIQKRGHKTPISSHSLQQAQADNDARPRPAQP